MGPKLTEYSRKKRGVWLRNWPEKSKNGQSIPKLGRLMAVSGSFPKLYSKRLAEG
jgi:hypothetical protein